jgi:hypothetical protein
MHATTIEQVRDRITTTDGTRIFYKDWEPDSRSDV